MTAARKGQSGRENVNSRCRSSEAMGNARVRTQSKIKRSIGYLDDNGIPFEHLSATEYLFYVGNLYGIEDRHKLLKTIRDLENLLGIDHPDDKFIREYSSGLLKRIALASVLINEPGLLLLDEPLNNLDPIGAKLFKEHLKHLRQNGAAILVATHNLDFAEKVSDYVFVIEEGQQIFQGSIDTMRKQFHPEEGDVSLEDLYSMLSVK